jgi:hypothetical protein
MPIFGFEMVKDAAFFRWNSYFCHFELIDSIECHQMTKEFDYILPMIDIFEFLIIEVGD